MLLFSFLVGFFKKLIETFSPIIFNLSLLSWVGHMAVVNVGLQEAKLEIFDFVLLSHILMIEIPSNSESFNLKRQFPSEVIPLLGGKLNLSEVTPELRGYH